jgi:hypothetical protein
MPLSEAVVTITVIGLILAAVILTLYFRHRRYDMYHRERLAAIEKNLSLPEDFFELPARPIDSAYLLRGLIWLAVGIGMIAFFVTMGLAEGDRELFAAATLGLIPIGAGIAHLVVRRNELKKAAAETTAQP